MPLEKDSHHMYPLEAILKQFKRYTNNPKPLTILYYDLKSASFDISSNKPVYNKDLVISLKVLEKIKTILLLRNIKHDVIWDKDIYDGSKSNVGRIEVRLTHSYSLDLLNKDLRGGVEGWVLKV